MSTQDVNELMQQMGERARAAATAMARASAASNQCYFVDINVAGDLGVGRSVVCGPGGEVIHQAGDGREVIAFEVDFTYLRRCRELGWQGQLQHGR